MTAVVAREINASTPDMRDGHSKEHGDPVSSSSSNGAAAAAVSDRYADESYKLFSRIQVTDPTADEGRRIRNKLIWRIAPLSCIGYFLMFTDKQTVRPGSEEITATLGHMIPEHGLLIYAIGGPSSSWAARPSWAS